MERLLHKNNAADVLLNGEFKLKNAFYQRNNVVQIAKELLGKILVTGFDGLLTAARIVETEAYNGVIDKASHAFGGRRTARTEVAYRNGGCTYVYLCYGIHHLFNVVTSTANEPHVVLIRAGEPVYGIATMLYRTKKAKPDYTLTKGPGNITRALGITTINTGADLSGNEIYIIEDGYSVAKKNIIASKRIGIDYAEEDALLPYRFYIKSNPFVSGKSNI